MVKLVSKFSVGGATRKSTDKKAGTEPPAGEADMRPGGDADDPRMEAAFAQLEREMESVDENDPRAMGRMMRRMSDLTGEKLDGEMEEMVRKLEEGQDPEKIEEQMGELLGDEGEGAPGYGGMGGGFSGPPTRDPGLYDY
jgi:hypothetical protein